MSSPQNIVRRVIGGEMGPSAQREGVTEAARRLSHALSEVVAVLQVDDYQPTRQAVARAIEKARGTVEEWGVL